MTNIKKTEVKQLELLLASATSAAGKIKTLSTFQEKLHEKEVAKFLCDYASSETDAAVKLKTLDLLAKSKSNFLANYLPYLDLLLRALAFELNSDIRKIAVREIALKSEDNISLLDVLLETFATEPDPEVQRICLQALNQKLLLPEDIYEKIVKLLPGAPLGIQHQLFEIIKKSGNQQWIEPAALQLLSPATEPALRMECLETLKKAASLKNETTQQLAEMLTTEPDPESLEIIAEILFSQADLSASIAEKTISTLLSFGEITQKQLDLLENQFRLRSGLFLEFVDAIAEHPNANIRIRALRAFKNSGLIQLWEMALRDKNYVVREQAVLLSDYLLSQQPEKMLLLLVNTYANEENPHLKKTIVNKFRKHAHLLNAVDPNTLAPLFEEKDPLLQREVASLSLEIPYDKTLNNEVLMQGWLRLLQLPSLPFKEKNQLLDKLQYIGEADSPALEKALQIVLTQVHSFTELQQLFPLLMKSIKDPEVLLPGLILLLEKFIGYYPAEPLAQIMRLMSQAKTLLPEVEKKMTYLVSLTGETWMLKQVSESDQKNELYAAITRHFFAFEFAKAALLIKEGYENSTLRKSEVVELYKLSLTHPGMYEIVQVLIPIMKETNLITMETLLASLKYATTYQSGNTINNDVLSYILALGPQLSGFDKIYFDHLNQDTFLDFVFKFYEQSSDATYATGKYWDEWRRWHVPYPKWHLYEELNGEDKPEWLRIQLENRIKTDIPETWTTALFALKQYHLESNYEIEDLLAIGRVYKQAKAFGTLPVIHDRAQCLFSLIWTSRIDFSIIQKETSNDELWELATEIFANQIYNWLDIGGRNFPGRVMPMPGVSLSLLRKIWNRSSEEWQTFLDGYAELFGINGLQVIPPEPDTTRYKDFVYFHRLDAGDHLSKLISYFLVTPAPGKDDEFLYKWWVEQVSKASEEHPVVFSDQLRRMDKKAKNQVAELLNN